MSFSRISVIGLGYIGLPTAAMLASHKIQVIGVDVNQNAVDTINRGEIHIVEPELDTIVYTAVEGGYLKASTEPQAADAFLIAVPTPFKESFGEVPSPDLSFIESAIKAIAPVLKKGDLIILESTSPVGTTEKMAEWLAKLRTDLTFPQKEGDSSDVGIAYCPERVLPGRVVHELIENDRVIGGITSKCSERAVELYKIFVEGECVVTNARTAEMVKLTENSCRDVQIAFANELSIICDKLEINVWELIELSNRHPRINILQPGPGVGGHCIAVDPWFIVSKTPDEAQIIHMARIINDAKPKWVENKVKEAIEELLFTNPEKRVEEIVIACLGLAFKADIDDLRESPALEIVKGLSKVHPGPLLLVEPNISKQNFILSDLGELSSLEQALAQADIVLLLVDHKQFRDINRPNKVVIDTKGVWAC